MELGFRLWECGLVDAASVGEILIRSRVKQRESAFCIEEERGMKKTVAQTGNGLFPWGLGMGLVLGLCSR